jgi:hypothetical protein
MQKSRIQRMENAMDAGFLHLGGEKRTDFPPPENLHGNDSIWTAIRYIFDSKNLAAILYAKRMSDTT